jgi:hypothetical protein
MYQILNPDETHHVQGGSITVLQKPEQDEARCPLQHHHFHLHHRLHQHLKMYSILL